MSAYSFVLYTHITTSIAALFLFWVPALSKKGSLNHVKFGTFYARAMYVAILSGIALALVIIASPQWARPEAFANATSPEHIEQIELSFRQFFFFIFYLGIFTLSMVYHGVSVYAQPDHTKLRELKHVSLPVFGLIFGSALLVLGIIRTHPLFIAFALLGMATTFGQLRYCLRKTPDAKVKVTEHLAALIGSGIGAHTAFFTFGARQLLELEGPLQLVTWIAPGVLGGIAIAWFTRVYGQPRKVGS